MNSPRISRCSRNRRFPDRSDRIPSRRSGSVLPQTRRRCIEFGIGFSSINTAGAQVLTLQRIQGRKIRRSGGSGNIYVALRVERDRRRAGYLAAAKGVVEDQLGVDEQRFVRMMRADQKPYVAGSVETVRDAHELLFVRLQIARQPAWAAGFLRRPRSGSGRRSRRYGSHPRLRTRVKSRPGPGHRRHQSRIRGAADFL